MHERYHECNTYSSCMLMLCVSVEEEIVWAGLPR